MNILTGLEIKKMREELINRSYSLANYRIPKGREYWNVDRIVLTLEHFQGILKGREAEPAPQSIISKGVAEKIKEVKKDWTVKNGMANNSEVYLSLVNEVDRIIRESGDELICGLHKHVARMIVSQLAHKHGLTVPETAISIYEDKLR